MKLLFARARYTTFPVEPFNMTADEIAIAAEANRIANLPGATIGERTLQGHIFKLLNDIRDLRSAPPRYSEELLKAMRAEWSSEKKQQDDRPREIVHSILAAVEQAEDADGICRWILEQSPRWVKEIGEQS